VRVGGKKRLVLFSTMLLILGSKEDEEEDEEEDGRFSLFKGCLSKSVFSALFFRPGFPPCELAKDLTFLIYSSFTMRLDVILMLSFCLITSAIL
jgi:hypothetical protein